MHSSNHPAFFGSRGTLDNSCPLPRKVAWDLVEILEQTVDSHWKVETDVVTVYEENSSSSPTLVVVGQMEDAWLTCDKVQTIGISCDCEERSCLLDTASKTVLDISTVPWATVPSLAQENDPRVTFSGQFMGKRDESEVGDHGDDGTVCVKGLTTVCVKGLTTEDSKKPRELGADRQDADAEKVFKRGHTVAGKSVQVKQWIPPPYYKDSVLVSGIPEGTSEDSLQNFLESVADVGVEVVQFSKAKGKAMICFGDTQVDLKFVKRLQQACQDNPLSGGVLSVSHCRTPYLYRTLTPQPQTAPLCTSLATKPGTVVGLCLTLKDLTPPLPLFALRIREV